MRARVVRSEADGVRLGTAVQGEAGLRGVRNSTGAARADKSAARGSAAAARRQVAAPIGLRNGATGHDPCHTASTPPALKVWAHARRALLEGRRTGATAFYLLPTPCARTSGPSSKAPRCQLHWLARLGAHGEPAASQTAVHRMGVRAQAHVRHTAGFPVRQHVRHRQVNGAACMYNVGAVEKCAAYMILGLRPLPQQMHMRLRERKGRGLASLRRNSVRTSTPQKNVCVLRASARNSAASAWR